MPVEVIRTIASVGSSILGSGTSVTCTSRSPCQVTAFMAAATRTCSSETARSPEPRAEPAQELAGPKRAGAARLERRRLEPRTVTESFEELTERVERASMRLPAEPVPRTAGVHQRDRERHIEPAGLGGLKAQPEGGARGGPHSRGGMLTSRAEKSSASRALSMTGSAAMLNAPTASPVIASR